MDKKTVIDGVIDMVWESRRAKQFGAQYTDERKQIESPIIHRAIADLEAAGFTLTGSEDDGFIIMNYGDTRCYLDLAHDVEYAGELSVLTQLQYISVTTHLWNADIGDDECRSVASWKPDGGVVFHMQRLIVGL